MKHISNLIDLNQVKQHREQESMEQSSHETAAVINWLFKELRSNFTAFKQAWPDGDAQQSAKKTWLKAFVLAGISRIEQLQHGLNKCYLMEKPFVPSPGQFIAWCTPNPQDFGFPTVHEAFNISGKINTLYSDYIHPHIPTDTVIKHVIKQIGATSFRSMNEKSALKLFESYYDIACRQFIEGKIEPIKRALPQTADPHPSDKPRSDEARKKAMESIRSMGIAIKTGLPENNIQPRD